MNGGAMLIDRPTSKILDISSDIEDGCRATRENIRELRGDDVFRVLPDFNYGWTPNHNIGKWGHNGSYFILEADGRKNSTRFDNSLCTLADFTPSFVIDHLRMEKGNPTNTMTPWDNPKVVGREFFLSLKKRAEEVIDMDDCDDFYSPVLSTCKSFLFNEYSLDVAKIPNSVRDWHYSKTPLGKVTVFMNLATLAAINYGSFHDDGVDCSKEKALRVSTSRVIARACAKKAVEKFGIPLVLTGVGKNGAQGHVSDRRILPHNCVTTKEIGHGDAGWMILTAMSYLGFDADKFKAIIHLDCPNKAKRGLYMTFDCPTHGDKPIKELTLDEMISSKEPVAKGDIGKIFQAALSS